MLEVENDLLIPEIMAIMDRLPSLGLSSIFKVIDDLSIPQIMARFFFLGLCSCVRGREWTFDSPDNGQTSFSKG